jgi:hypothetical protein
MSISRARKLHELHSELAACGATLRIIEDGAVRDLLRADGIEDKVGGLTVL